MTHYGFRLYTLEATDARTRPRLAFTDQGFSRYLSPAATSPQTFVASLLRSMQGKSFVREAAYSRIGEPVPSPDELPERTPLLRVDRVECVENRIEVLVTYGRKGSHPTATPLSGGPDRPLDDAAASRPYRVTLYFPVDGESAIMVSEVAGRTHVGAALIQRLSVENATNASARGDMSHGWLRLMPLAMFDEDRIAEVLRNGSIEGLMLQRRSSKKSGSRGSRSIHLTQNGLPEAKHDAARKLLSRWMKRHLQIKDPNDDGTTPVSALLEFVDTDADLDALGFDDGSFRFSEGGRSQSLGPSNLARILTYPLTDDRRPTSEELHRAAVERLKPLSQCLSIPIDFT